MTNTSSLTGAAAACAAFIAVFTLGAGPAAAQEVAAEDSASPALRLELNALQPSERGCRFTFLAENRIGAEITGAAFELALFDKAGMINRITIIDFRDLPEGKSKVRQFDFPNVDCAEVGRILVNDATECVGEGLDPRACIRALDARTPTDITFGT